MIFILLRMYFLLNANTAVKNLHGDVLLEENNKQWRSVM